MVVCCSRDMCGKCTCLSESTIWHACGGGLGAHRRRQAGLAAWTAVHASSSLYTHVIPTPIFPAALTLPALKKHGDHRILAACNQSMHFFGELGACNNEGRQGSGVHLFARCYFFIFSKWKLLNSASFQPSADIKGSCLLCLTAHRNAGIAMVFTPLQLAYETSPCDNLFLGELKKIWRS